MGLFRVLKKGVKSGFNFKRMVSYEKLAEDSKFIKQLYQGATQRDGEAMASRARDFTELMRINNMDEAGLEVRIRKSAQVCLMCLSFAVPLFFYTFFLWHKHLLMAGLMSLVLALVLSVFAFRESFNRFQMKQRRLGCTVKEWFNDLIKGSK